MSALRRLAPLAPRLTASNLCKQQQRGFAASGGLAESTHVERARSCYLRLDALQLASIDHRVSFAVGHGDAKVNCWEQPTNISNWKEEHVRKSLVLELDSVLTC